MPEGRPGDDSSGAAIGGSAIQANPIHCRNTACKAGILARTSPTLMDLMVALASGAVGAYATVSPRLSVAFVGVAIATALVPPLCAACILFTHGKLALGLGAVLLTFLNMVAIHVSSSLVLWLAGFRPRRRVPGSSIAQFVRHHLAGLILLAVLAAGLAVSLHRMVARTLYESALRARLAQQVEASPGCHLAEVRLETSAGGTNLVRAVLRGPRAPTPEQVAVMEDGLPPSPDGRPSELRVRFVTTLILSRHGELYHDTPFGAHE